MNEEIRERLKRIADEVMEEMSTRLGFIGNMFTFRGGGVFEREDG